MNIKDSSEDLSGESLRNEPDAESDDLVTVLRLNGDSASGSGAPDLRPNTISMGRYEAQFEGNSSEEEEGDVGRKGGELFAEFKGEDENVRTNPDFEGGADEIDENNEADDEVGYYQPLIADEFGEFVCAQDFGDYYTPDPIGQLSQNATAVTAAAGHPAEEMAPEAEVISNDTSREESKTTAAPTVDQLESAANDATTSAMRISVPPLDAAKIATIKAAMANVKIGKPTFGAVSIANNLLESRSKLRLGDEVTTAAASASASASAAPL